MKLSLVTGTLNRPDAFKRLVDSIIERTTVDCEVVVADASDEPVAYDDSRVRILREFPRLGCVKGYNRAFRDCRGEWVIFLNDDAEVCPHYDVNAIAFMEQYPQTGLGALHYSENGGPFRVNSAWGCVYGNFGIIRRSLGDHVGWFDESLIMYGNDNSLALRVLLAGYGVSDIPDSRILHHSVNDEIRQQNQQYKMRDNDVLTRKYMPMRQDWLRNYHQFRVPTKTVPWAHGVRPTV